MKVIHKYKLQPGAPGVPFSVELPYEARILHVGMQDGIITLWALVHKDSNTEERFFCVLMTGQTTSNENASKMAHLATMIVAQVVLHVFEVLQ